MSAPRSWCCRRTRRTSRQGRSAAARVRDRCDRGLGPSGDEFDARRSTEPDGGRRHACEQDSNHRARWHWHALPRWRLPRRPRISSRRCSVASAGAAPLYPDAVRERGRFDAGPARRDTPRMAAAARRFACGPATGAISRSRRPTMPAGRRPATVSARRARPKSSMAATSTTPRPKRKTLFGTAERVPLSQRDRRGLHLQRQGPDRARAGQDRGRPDLRKGDIVAGENGLLVAGRSATNAGRAELLAGIGQGPRQI